MMQTYCMGGICMGKQEAHAAFCAMSNKVFLFDLGV